MISIGSKMSRLLFKFFDAQGEKISHLRLWQRDHAARNLLISNWKYFLALRACLGIVVACSYGNKRIYSSYANCKRQLVFF